MDTVPVQPCLKFAMSTCAAFVQDDGMGEKLAGWEKRKAKYTSYIDKGKIEKLEKACEKQKAKLEKAKARCPPPLPPPPSESVLGTSFLATHPGRASTCPHATYRHIGVLHPVFSSSLPPSSPSPSGPFAP
eukprot:5542658-Prymnesium_polylepis.1